MAEQDASTGETDHESYSKMSEEPAAEKEPGAMKLDSVSVRPAENGGFIVSCSRSRASDGDGGGNGAMPGPSYSSKDYAFGNTAELMAFLQTELA